MMSLKRGFQQLDGSVHPDDRRQATLLLAVLVGSVALRLVTWNPIADGDFERFAKVAVFAGAAAALVWLLVRLQTVAESRVPLICAAGVMLAGDAIHYTRLLSPITRGAPVTAVDVPFSDETAVRRAWSVELAGGEARFEPGAVVLHSPTGAAAYVQARIPSVPDVATQWWLPAGLANRQRVERLAWRASMARTGDFYVVFDAPRMLLQAVGYGVHVTYPDARDQLQGHEVQVPMIADGRAHDWLVIRTSREITLAVDGRQVWAAPQRGELNQMRLGETKRDPLHGGTMRIESASYHATLER